MDAVKEWSVSLTLVALMGACGTGAACSSSAPEPEVEASGAAGAAAPRELEEATAKVFEDSESHADQAPHGGAIVPLGAHSAHAELVVVPDFGELTLYVLDAEGRAGQRIAQPTVVLDVETSGRLLRLEMSAVPDEAAGERVGDASRFVVRSEDLIRMAQGQVTIKWIGVNGQVFSDVIVNWPPLDGA